MSDRNLLVHPTLADLGFAPAQEQALRVLWGTDLLDAIYKPAAFFARAAGYDPARIIDAHQHRLLDDTFMFFYRWDIPAHWVNAMVDNITCNSNLRTSDEYVWDEELLDYAFKANPVPYDFFLNALQAATNHDDVWADVRRWVNANNPTPGLPEETVMSVEAGVESLAGLKTPPLVFDCTC